MLSLLVEYDHPVLTVLASDPSFYSIFSCWAAAVLAAPFLEEFLFRAVLQHWFERLSVSKLNNNQLFLGGSNAVESTDSFAERELLSGHSSAEVIPTASLVRPDHESERRTFHDLNPYQPPSIKALDPIEPTQTSGPQFGYWPILVSSVLFAAVHIGQGLAPIPLFFLAVGLGYLFRQTGSLIACVTVHFLLNFYSMLVFTIMILSGETP